MSWPCVQVRCKRKCVHLVTVVIILRKSRRDADERAPREATSPTVARPSPGSPRQHVLACGVAAPLLCSASPPRHERRGAPAQVRRPQSRASHMIRLSRRRINVIVTGTTRPSSQSDISTRQITTICYHLSQRRLAKLNASGSNTYCPILIKQISEARANRKTINDYNKQYVLRRVLKKISNMVSR